MKQKLLLTSQGLSKELENIFLSVLDKSPQKKQCFIYNYGSLWQ